MVVVVVVGFGLTASAWTTVSVTPWSSVTRSPITIAWGVSYAFLTVGTVSVSVSNVPLPSRSHSYFLIAPSSLDDDASNVTVSPTVAGLGANVNAAVGARCTTTSTDAVRLTP